MTDEARFTVHPPELPPFRTRRTLEDFVPGEVFPLGTLALSREAILAFAAAYDPQPFHLDEAIANASLLRGLAASGWQGNVIMYRLLAEAVLGQAVAGRITRCPLVRWHSPVRPDQPLAIRADVKAIEPPASAGAPGTVVFAIVADDEGGKPAITMELQAPVASSAASATAADPAPTAETQAPEGERSADPDGAIGWYEDLTVGRIVDHGAVTVSDEEAAAFAALYDPLVLADRRPDGRVPVSPWQIGCIWMRKWVEFTYGQSALAADPRLHAGVTGPAPGMDDLAWPAEAMSGTPIAFETKLIDKRVSTSKPEWGLAIRQSRAWLPDGGLAPRFSLRRFRAAPPELTLRSCSRRRSC